MQVGKKDDNFENLFLTTPSCYGYIERLLDEYDHWTGLFWKGRTVAKTHQESNKPGTAQVGAISKAQQIM